MLISKEIKKKRHKNGKKGIKTKKFIINRIFFYKNSLFLAIFVN